MMGTNMQFIPTESDDASGLSMLHFSYIIQNIIPLSVVDGHKIVEFDKAFEEKQEVSAYEDITPVAVGSTSEGLNMPDLVEVTDEGSRSLQLSDLDILQVMNQFTITFDESKRQQLMITYDVRELFPWDLFALVETNNIHPGYARLYRPKSSLSDVYHDREMSLMNFALHHTDREEYVGMIQINGPALTIPVSASDRRINGKPLPLDKVLALPCQEWPPTANSFKERFKTNNWPWLKGDLMKRIIEGGCHIVPVHHRAVVGNKRRDEWRISFATSERLIAREALTNFQKQAYIAIKVLYHHKLKKLELLSSYHMKTVFFHVCERIHATHWRDNMGSCILYFLDILIKCVRKGNIPSFFIPENNLIDYLTEEELTTLEVELTEIRSKPLDQLLAFFDHKYVEEIRVKLDYTSIFSPVIYDMDFYCELRNFDLTLKEVLRPCSISIMVKYIKSKNYKEAVRTAKHVHFLSRKCTSEKETLAKLVLSAVVEIEDSKAERCFLNYVTCQLKEDESFDCCKSYLKHLEQQPMTADKTYCCVM